MKKFKNLILLSFLLMITSLSFSQTTYTPKRYWTFNTNVAGADSTGNNALNLTGYGNVYTIESNGPVSKYLNLPDGTSYITAGSLTLNQGVTVEFLYKPGFERRNSNMVGRDNNGFSIGFSWPNWIFSTGGSVPDYWEIPLNGIGKASSNYYSDGNWHHMAFKYNATTGVKEVWVDGTLVFTKTIASGSFNNSVGGISFGGTVGYAVYYGGYDEIAIYDNAIPGSLIYKHYLGIQQHTPYSYLDNYTGTIPNSGPLTAGIDPNEFAPGHPNVALLPTEQMVKFPGARYKPGHTLSRNFEWMNPDYMGGQFQTWSPTIQTTGQYGSELQIQLAERFNFYFGVRLGVTINETDPRAVLGTTYANTHPNIPLSTVIFRGYGLWDQTKPNNYYLRNANNQFIDANGNVSSTKLWSPAAPSNGYTSDGNYQYNRLNNTTMLTRNIDIINEDGEFYPVVNEAGMQADPAVVADKNNTGLSWTDYLITRYKDNENQSYRDIIMSHPKMQGAIYTEYAICGQKQYSPSYPIRRTINYQINGQYYATPDFYVRWPSNWRYWVSAWHGWQWMIESRHTEIQAGDTYYSPFVAAGWSANPEDNVRPSQWLGLLKNHTAMGAEFFYAGHFSTQAPWPNSKDWIWQSVIPAYAQALESRVENLYKNSFVMEGDEPAIWTIPNPDPSYQFRTGDKNKMVVVRKHNSQNEYYITASLNPLSNMMGAAPEISSATINLDGNNITFEVRRQGSVYVYNSTTNVFYQLDGWHETGHPYNWSKDFNIEAELFDNTNNGIIKTEVPAGTPVRNYINFTSYLSWTGTPNPIEYNIDNRTVNTYYLWVRAKSKDGSTTGLTVKMDNGAIKTIGCINDTNWVWYRYESPANTIISYNSLSIGDHKLTLTPTNNKLYLDKAILTINSNLNLNNNGPNCSQAVAVITANGLITFCQGGNVTLTANSGISYLWSNGATTQGITVNTSGSYSCTVTSTGGTAVSNTITVTVNPLPTATISASGPTTFCQGGSVTLTSSSGTSYLWSNGATTQSISVNASGNYLVTVTNSNGCSKTSNTTTITVNSVPTATISASGPTTFCQGGSVTLTSSSGTSYLWSNGATTQSINVNVSGSYSVTVTNNGCSKTSSATTIIVNSLPTATITANGSTTLCAGQSVILTSSAGSSYLWSNGATTQSITTSTAGNYTVIITNANGCSKTSNIITVVVNALPTVTATNVSGCAGTPIALLGSPSGGTFSVSNPYTGPATTYTYTYTNANGCSNTSTPANITITTIPVVTALNVSGCAGTPIALSGSPAGGTFSVPNPYTGPSTTYTYTYNAGNGCSATSTPATITINPLPIVNITSNGSTSLCNGQSVTLTSSSASSYLWNTGATSQAIIVNSSGNYSVTATNQFGCTAQSSPITITTSTIPSANVSINGSTTLCDGQTVSLTADLNNQYLWNNGAITQTITVNASGNYYVTVSNQFGCTATSTPISVSVNSSPITTINPSGSINICSGQTTVLTASGGSQYLWSNGATTQSITIGTAGNYVVTSTDINGCTSESPATSVTVSNCTTCTVPTNLITTNIQSNSATLNWTLMASPTISYTIRLRKVLSFLPAQYFNTTANSIVVSVDPGSKYRWSVRSKCSGGTKSSWAKNKVFKTPSSRLLIPDDTTNVNSDLPIVPKCKIDDFDMFPNPANNSVSMCFKSPVKSKVKIIFYSNSGQAVKIHEMNGELDVNTVTLSIDNLLPGIYNVKVISDSFIYSKQLTVIRL